MILHPKTSTMPYKAIFYVLDFISATSLGISLYSFFFDNIIKLKEHIQIIYMLFGIVYFIFKTILDYLNNRK